MSGPNGAGVSGGVSQVYTEEGESWLRVSPGHSISERWLQERAPDLYAQWWAAPSGAQRDQLAHVIEQRLDELEAAPTWRQAANAAGERADSALVERVSRYEDQAERLGMIAIDDPTRPGEHLRFQHEGDRLRDELATAPIDAQPELLTRRLEAAELAADRPVLEAASGYTVQVDRLAVGALAGNRSSEPMAVSADAVRAEMIAEHPQAALRADVLTAVAAAGYDAPQLRGEVERHGVDLAQIAPALLPASDFNQRHAAAIDATLDREIAAGGFDGLPSYMAAWRHARPATMSLHDTERAIVEHVVAGVITSSDPGGADARAADRMWQRAADRVALREWSAAHRELEAPVDRVDGPERQLELGLMHFDDAVAETGHDAEQEVG
ncbi:hypothetical protein M6B22_07110 [Jatrophihabitans cynanchi]|uniref:Uncharacterized protein n=1 Tax=Jatrophihabitans cynanchi TaxID=2944128 RepID=A0ABY7K0Z9_9ACTN|nr:hypothetical protein [Jatrophihabitans sp. SB3-54]WAX58526.1 hypothetical protein M6B22_07110 [Jatrophihabitans sp. SB3-54]